jgi:hypothetical protein
MVPFIFFLPSAFSKILALLNFHECEMAKPI